ncbi:hypothetical protein Tco_0545789 [Tanacetum coccineum]
MENFETPPNSPPVVVIDPDDDQTMWSSTRTIDPTPSFAIIQLLIYNNFDIKGTHMQMIRDIQLDGRIRSNPHRHVADFLDISSLFQYGENQEEAVKLRTFPFSLSGEAKTWNHQEIIENLERKFEYLKKIQHSKSFPRTTNTKLRHEFVYKPPSIRNENDKGDVASIEEDDIKPIPTMPNSNQIMSNSPTVSTFFKDCTMHISYTNAKTFADDALLNHVGDKELKSIDGVGNGVLTKTKIKKDGVPTKLNKEWKLNEKEVIEEDAWRRNELISHIYASICVAFYRMEFDRDFFRPGSFVLVTPPNWVAAE